MNTGTHLLNDTGSPLNMDNSTEEAGSNKTIRALFCTATGGHQLFLSVVNYFLSVTAILGNLLIVVALRKSSRLHPPSKLLLRCLTATDLCVGIISEPSYATYLVSYKVKTEHWMLLCEYTGSITTFTFTVLSAVSLLTLTAISVDRLLALSLKMKYRQVVTLNRVRVAVLCFWIPSIVFGSMSFLSLTISKGFGYTVKFGCVIISAFCYTRIYFVLRRHQAQTKDVCQQGDESKGEKSLNMAQYRKTVSSAIWVQLSLVVCYLPYSVVIAIITLTKLTPSLYIAWGYTATFVYFNSSLNPFLYCWKIREIRKAVKDTLMRRSESESDSSESDRSTNRKTRSTYEQEMENRVVRTNEQTAKLGANKNYEHEMENHVV